MKSDNPKVFLSYDHGQLQLVTSIAENLMSNGIDVLFDVWDLTAGEDLFQFMESSVTDPDVDFVLIISDAVYKRKADARDGSGVSTEAVILSPKVYSESTSARFIPIATELDENDVAQMPTFVSSKLYIDFTLISKSFDESMDELIRRIYNEPQMKKPDLGQKPDFDKKADLKLLNLKNIESEIERTRDINPRHSAHSYRDSFLPEFLDVFCNWLDSCNSDDILESSSKMIEANTIFMRTTDNILSENDFVGTTVLTTFFSNLLQVTGINAEADRRTKDSLAGFERYILFLRVASIYLKNDQFDSLNYFLYFKYHFNQKTTYSIFYPDKAIQNINSDNFHTLINYVEDSMNRQEFHLFIQIDLLLYYIYKINVQSPNFWYPLFWGKWTKFNSDFPLLNSLFDKDSAMRVSKLFGFENVDQLYSKMKDIEPIVDRIWGLFLDFPLPNKFFQIPSN